MSPTHIVRSAAIAIAFIACTRGDQSDPTSREPQGAVLAVFEASKKGRCEDVLGLLAKSQRDRAQTDQELCPAFLGYLRRHPLERIHSVSKDGRRGEQRIVQVTLKNTSVVRSFTVEKEQGLWRLASL